MYARQKFATGDSQTKREIFTALGQNFTLKDRKLFIDKEEWFIPIEKAYPALKLEFDRLELNKTLTEYERNVQMQQIILTWGRTLFAFRTLNWVQIKSDLHIFSATFPNYCTSVLK